MLTLRQIEDICLVGDGPQECRFLSEDNTGKFYCIKLTHLRNAIDDEVSEFENKCASVSKDPADFGVPLGDNCKGYTFLKYKNQGYDV